MPQTQYNGVQTIANSDAYNLANDLAKLGQTINAIVPVTSDAQRNALAPPQGVFAGMTVARTDKPGVPLEILDSTLTTWQTKIALKIITRGTSIHEGSDSTLQSDILNGLFQPILQVGSDVVATDVNGYGNLPFPTPFPNGLIAAVAVNGDDNATGPGYDITLGSATSGPSYLYINCSRGTTAWSNHNVRVDWFALGW